jgi:hypothetical protein
MKPKQSREQHKNCECFLVSQLLQKFHFGFGRGVMQTFGVGQFSFG